MATTSVEVSYMSLLLQADPEFYARQRDEKLFEFDNGRIVKRGDPRKRNTAYPDA